jgi:ribosomal protein L40E
MITTFCPRCGSENPFENQFCGKCGIPLLQPKPAEQPVAAARGNGSQHPVSTAEPELETDQSIHGPSFLGLSDEPDLSSYLLDEEASVSHWGVYLFLVVLAAAAGLVWWQTRHGGLDRSHLANIVQQARSKIGQEKQEAAAVAPNASPGAAENSGVANASTGASHTGANNGTASPAVAPPPTPAQIQSAAEKQNVPPAALSQTAALAKPPSLPSKPLPKPRPAADASAATSADAQNAALLNNAQKYLYGQGVPQSCDRALNYLRQAVDNDSAKAKSTLGGMYATGHCVPLDRAVAYKWFALALRQSPNNSYLSHDLEMLWNQMTPAQKQLAIRMTQ